MQAVLGSHFNAFNAHLGDILSRQLADALAAERTKTDIAIAQVLHITSRLVLH